MKEAVLARTRLVEEEDVEIIPEQIPASCLDKNVCVQSVQKYFSEDTWAALKQVIEVVQKNDGIAECVIDDDGENSIMCDSCMPILVSFLLCVS